MTQVQIEWIHSIASLITRNVLKIFWIFPVKKNRIAFLSYSGKQYSCNPKYIAHYLRENYPQKFELIFAVRDLKKWHDKEIRFVRFLSLQNLYYFCTAKVLISNCGMPTYLPKRKQQYMINTWHGGGAYKQNTNYFNESIPKARIAMDLYKSHSTDLVLSSCENFSNHSIPDLVYHYQGEILPCGMPRNDIIYHLKNHLTIRKQICDRYHFEPNRRIVLYAPTFRGNFDNINIEAGKEYSVNLDVQGLLKAVQIRFHGDPVLLVKAHHAMNLSFNWNSPDVINVSDYPDSQELLCATDILISDYSSIIWDFSLTKRPCFLYVPDLDYYIKEDRGTYTPVESWPGILAKSSEELQKAILEFNESSYREKVERHHHDLGSYENGTACEQVCERIAEVCGVTDNTHKKV